MNRQKSSSTYRGGRFGATLHHLRWLYTPFQRRWFNKAPDLPFIRQTQNSSQALINPQSRKKKKAIIYSSQSTEKTTDVEIKCFTQDHRAASSGEGMKVLHTNPTSLSLTQTRKREDSGDNWGAAWQPGGRRDRKILGMQLKQKQRVIAQSTGKLGTLTTQWGWKSETMAA